MFRAARQPPNLRVDEPKIREGTLISSTVTSAIRQWSRRHLRKLIDRFGGLTILHNNAGGSTLQDGPVTEAPEEEFWRVMKLDLYGTFLCSKIGIPHIIKSGGGAIINMSSSIALSAVPGRDCYTAAKGAIAALTRSMAVEYAKHKIRVNAIAPSVTLSDRVKKLLEGSKDIEKLAATHLFGLGLPIHMADMAVYSGIR